MSKAWMPFYQNDYLADTVLLSLEEHGAYILLMSYYWNHASAPANASLLHKVCRCTNDAERSAVDHVVKTYFKVDGDRLRHKRLDEELKKANEIREKRQVAAAERHKKKGAKAPANADASADANDMQMHTQSQSHIKPIVGQIISHLNRVTGKTYSPDSKATVKHISGRLSEGYEFDHFRKAIDNQWSAWRGTDMEQYMRPQTLFNSEKFDGYVNNTKSGGKGYID